jgi:hypothetical protein
MEVSGQLHNPALHPWGKSPLYPMDRSLGGLQSRFKVMKQRKSPAPTRNRIPAVQPVSRRYTDWAMRQNMVKICPQYCIVKRRCTHPVTVITYTHPVTIITHKVWCSDIRVCHTDKLIWNFKSTLIWSYVLGLNVRNSITINKQNVLRLVWNA